MAGSSFDITSYLNVLAKRKGLFFLTALTIMSLGTLYTYILPKKYIAACTVFIEKSMVSQLVQGIAITQSVDDTVRVLTAAMSSRTLIQRVIKDVDFNLNAQNDAQIEKLITELQQNTEIKVSNNDLFLVKLKYSDPRLARDYVNSLVRHYIEENISSKKTESYDATSFLSEQVAAYKKKMNEIEAEMNQYKNEKSSLVNLDAGQLFREINMAQQKLFDLQLRKKQLEEEKTYAKSASDPARQNLAQLQKRLDELRVQYTENYPEVLHVKSQIEALQEDVNIKRSANGQAPVTQDIWKIEAELKAIRENEVSVQGMIAENKRVLASIPSAKNVMEKLEASKASQKNMHDLLAMRSGQAEISKQIDMKDKGTNFRVVDPATTPSQPISPNRKKLLMMSIVAGFAGGAALLLFLDQLDQSVKLLDNLKPLGIPVLAVIPLITSKEEIQSMKIHDLKIYVASGTWFSVIVAIFLMEGLGMTHFEKLIFKLHLPQIFAILIK